MKEKGPIRNALEKVAKVWTVVSIPVELFLLGHGIATGNKIEAFLGAAGLIGDFFALKWLDRDKRNESRSVSVFSIDQRRGSERAASTYSPRLETFAQAA